MEDELWLKKIKDKLEDYSEPLPVAGWERLEKELSVSGAPITGPHRMIPFRRWAVAAAAVLLVAVSSVSLWLLQSPVGNEMRHTSVPALAVAPDVLPEQTVPAVRTNPIEPAYRAHGNASAPNREASRPLVAQHIRISVDDERQEEMLPVETAGEAVGIGQQAEEQCRQRNRREQGKTAIVRQAGTNCIFRKETVLVGILKDGRLACP